MLLDSMDPWNGWSADDWVRHYAGAPATHEAGRTFSEMAQSAELAVHGLVEAPGKFVHEHEHSLKIAAVAAIAGVCLVAFAKK